jgi:hypothetical protein
VECRLPRGGQGFQKEEKVKRILMTLSSILSVVGMGTQGLLNAADCLPSTPDGWRVPFTMMTLSNYATNPYASYVNDSFSASRHDSLMYHSETFASQSSQRLLSNQCETWDRTVCVQPFYINRSDYVTVSVTKNWSALINPIPTYSATLTLGAVGAAKITFPLTCDATTGILYGSTGGDTHVAITTGTPVRTQ